MEYIELQDALNHRLPQFDWGAWWDDDDDSIYIAVKNPLKCVDSEMALNTFETSGTWIRQHGWTIDDVVDWVEAIMQAPALKE